MYPKIKTPYGVKLVKVSYPILSGARFGPTEEDVDEAINKGFSYGAETVTNYLKNAYLEAKSMNPFEKEITADEVLNRVYNRNLFPEKGPTVESYHSSKTSTIHNSPELERRRSKIVETTPSTPIKQLSPSITSKIPHPELKSELKTEFDKLRAKNKGSNIKKKRGKEIIKESKKEI